MPRKTPSVNPTSYLNSGSKKFTAQQASIYKIVFFNEQNELAYENYLKNTTTTQTSNTNSNTQTSNQLDFLVQNTVSQPRFVFRAGC